MIHTERTFVVMTSSVRVRRKRFVAIGSFAGAGTLDARVTVEAMSTIASYSCEKQERKEKKKGPKISPEFKGFLESQLQQ